MSESHWLRPSQVVAHRGDVSQLMESKHEEARKRAAGQLEELKRAAAAREEAAAAAATQQLDALRWRAEDLRQQLQRSVADAARMDEQRANAARVCARGRSEI